MIFASLYAGLLVAAGSSVVSAASQTYYPSQMIQLDKSGGGGVTTEPNIQNKSNIFSLEVAFTLPNLSDAATCTLGFQTTGKNSESDWVAFIPDGSADINVSPLQTPMDSTKDTYANHAQAGDVANIMKITFVSGGGMDVAFSPATIPCSSAPGLLFEPGGSTMILGWTQTGDHPDGLQLVVDDGN